MNARIATISTAGPNAQLTGRYILSFKRGSERHVADRLSNLGFQVAGSNQTNMRPLPKLGGTAEFISPMFVVVVQPTPPQITEFVQWASADGEVVLLEPERRLRIEPPPTDRTFWERSRAWFGKVIRTDFEWSLATTGVYGCPYSGKGVKLGIIDTGIEGGHPDFTLRKNIVLTDFVGDGQDGRDGVGHGTHCAGIACGPLQPFSGARYGVAPEADIYSARVLDNEETGHEADLVKGILWALEHGCTVISISAEFEWKVGDSAFSELSENAIQFALDAGCLVVAAAGNRANKFGSVGAVGVPGNSPSALTVAALDGDNGTARFSNRVRSNAPEVKGPDIAAPGVDIRSAWMGASYEIKSGTSMATPHVAGIAALYAEANPTIRGKALKDLLLQNCLALSQTSGEVGNGLVQAPRPPLVG